MQSPITYSAWGELSLGLGQTIETTLQILLCFLCDELYISRINVAAGHA